MNNKILLPFALVIIAFYFYVINLALHPNWEPFTQFYFKSGQVKQWGQGHGIDYALGDVIDTTNKSKYFNEGLDFEGIRYFSKAGWADTQAWGTCTNRKNKVLAEMFFKIPAQHLPHELVISGRPFLLPPIEAAQNQTLEIYLNGQLLDSVDYEEAKTVSIPIPNNMLNNFNGILRIRFKYLGIKSAHKTQPLGFCITNIQIL